VPAVLGAVRACFIERSASCVDDRVGRKPLGIVEQPLDVPGPHPLPSALQGQPERFRKRRQPFDLQRVRVVVDAKQRRHLVIRQPRRDRFVGREHELLDHPVRAIARLDLDPGHDPFDIQQNRRRRQIEVPAPPRPAPGLSRSRSASAFRSIAVTSGEIGPRSPPPLEKVGDLRIRQPRRGADDPIGESRRGDLPFPVEVDHDRLHEPVLARTQRAQIVGEPLGHHRVDAVGKVDARPARLRLEIDRVPGST
jgi:hypothetical protein